MRLVSSPAPVTYEGEFHRVTRLKLVPSVPQGLIPGVFVSGSSEAGLAAARALVATAIKYPKPADEEEPPGGLDLGIRVGIIARQTEDEAWEIARARFPEDRKGQLTRQLASKVSDSIWHKQLSEAAQANGMREGAYWMWPFENYQTFCPYLVGDYAQVAEQKRRVLEAQAELKSAAGEIEKAKSEARGHQITFRGYLRYGVPATLLTMIIATLDIWLRYLVFS